MELRQLEAFVAVAEERNFTRAAARLYVAQSGLSATIKALEQELHTDLFTRTTRRVDLTPAGLAFLPEARRTLAAAAAAVNAVNDVGDLRRGTLDIGVMQASGLFDVPGLLARFASTYPAIQVRLRQTSSAHLAALLAEGRLDVIFTTPVDDPPEGVQSFPVLRSPLVLITATDDAPAGRAPVDLVTVAQHRMVGFPVGWGIRTLTDYGMRSAGVEPRVDLEVNDVMSLLDLVESGLGVAAVPDAIARLRPSLTTTPLADTSLYWSVAAQTTAPTPVNPAARVLWEMLTRG